MATTDISIVNGSLVMVGADDINSFDDDTLEARLAKSVYTDTKQTLLQYYPWRFSLKQVDLGGALLEEPLFRKWKYKFQLPADTLRVISLEDEEDYEVLGDEIYSNVTPCRMIYQRKITEQDMPSYFVRTLQYHLAAIFSISLQEDKNKMDLFDRRADKETARARQIDAQQQPNQRISDKNFSLLNIRG